MDQVKFVRTDGSTQLADATEGKSVMQVARAALVPGIVAECGGELSCATCHVFVAPEWADSLPPRSSDEDDMLEVAAAEPTEFSRLSCQLTYRHALNGLTVIVPPVQ